MKKGLSVFLIFGLLLFIVSCGNQETNQVGGKDFSNNEVSEGIEVDKGILNVEISIPASLAGGLNEEDIEKEVAEKGYKSGRKNADGSVTYTMSKSKHKELLKEFDELILSLIDELVLDEDNSFTEIKSNKDYTDFTILVDSEKYSDWDSLYVIGLYMYSGFYQTFSGVAEEDLDLRIRMIDENGEEKYDYSFKDDFLGSNGEDGDLEEEVVLKEFDLESAKELLEGEAVTEEAYEITLDFSKITDDVLPPNPGSFYSHYEANDGRLYVDLALAYKNLESSNITAGDIGSASIIYSGDYNYRGFSIIESRDRGDFTYSNITSVSPLATEYIHFLFELPEEIKFTEGSLVALLNIKGDDYKVMVREGKSGAVKGLSEGASAKDSGSIKKGDIIALKNIAEFSIDFVQITEDVMPPSPADFYSHYAADDGKAYVDVAFKFKSWAKNPVNADSIFKAKLIYDGKYEYNGFTIVETNNRGDFTYSNITNFSPLITEYIHYLFEVPVEVKEGQGSLIMEFSISGGDYSLKIR